MIPFIAGEPFETLWRPFYHSIWGQQPITASGDIENLLAFWDSNRESKPIVLEIRSELKQPNLPQIPSPDSKTARGTTWKDVQELAANLDVQVIDHHQLALLIQGRKLSAIDVFSPSPIRYLLYKKDAETPIIARMSEPPGKFAGSLRRLQND